MNEQHALKNQLLKILKSIYAWLYIKSCFVKRRYMPWGKVRKSLFELGDGGGGVFYNFPLY